MSGVQKRPDGKKDVRYGLTFLKGYNVKMFGPLDAHTVGLPFERRRMFWLLLRKDVYNEAQLQLWYDNATILANRAIKPKPIETYFGIPAELVRDDVPDLMDSGSDSDSGPAETAEPVTKRRRLALQNTATDFMTKHGLAKFGSAAGSPYSGTALTTSSGNLHPTSWMSSTVHSCT